jgi:pSer/pThr/pTyr-binding forkhead associated (FHA) protein
MLSRKRLPYLEPRMKDHKSPKRRDTTQRDEASGEAPAAPAAPAPGDGEEPLDLGGGTRLESIEEIREATRAVRTPTLKEEAPGAELLPYRPTHRPPLALLCVLDDGQPDGEWVRIRTAKFTIGRSEGDLIIPHDTLMSGRHAQLSRQVEKGRHRWYLTDLESTNGTYVRVGKAALKHSQELLLGSHRYRFEAAAGEGGDGGGSNDEDAPRQTKGWEVAAAGGSTPSLVELTSRGDGQRFLLNKPENWVGRDAGQCAVARPNDPTVSPRHARLYRDAKGRWFIENARSLNGTWVRLDKVPIDGTGQFQLGEQRFLLRVL